LTGNFRPSELAGGSKAMKTVNEVVRPLYRYGVGESDFFSDPSHRDRRKKT